MNGQDLDLLNKLFRLQRLLGRFYHHKSKQHGPMGNIHRGQGRILSLLKLKPEISQKELSHILDMRPQSLGELLEKLERNGFITRTPAEKDQRVLNIRLTAAGQELSAQNEQHSDTDGLFKSLNVEEQAALNDYLDRIIATLEQKFIDRAQKSESHPHHRHKKSKEFARFNKRDDQQS